MEEKYLTFSSCLFGMANQEQMWQFLETKYLIASGLKTDIEQTLKNDPFLKSFILGPQLALCLEEKYGQMQLTFRLVS